MKCVSVVSNIKRDPNLTHTEKLVKTLLDADVQVKMPDDCYVTSAQLVKREELFKDSEMVIAMGGDGTILSLANECYENDIPIFGVNIGHMGFLSAMEKDDFSQLVTSKYHIEQRLVLKANVGDKELFALNDICISRGNSARIISLKVYADDKFVGTYKADGFIVSTPTGSTAYSLSAGGPVVHPSMELIILTPVCSHSLSNSRSVIIPATANVRIVVQAEHDNDAVVSADGQFGFPLKKGAVVEIMQNDKKLKLIRQENADFFDTLRLKLQR
ncbi:MAG: NAD(+)/NADH kinase [Eubacteriales bacterium]|nr:NAD(+)/NADH kinase [Eubacteriales bacterium]